MFERKYDCIWIQWVALYLTDKDLLSFFERARENLTVSEELDLITGTPKTGLIFVKENISPDRFLVDKDDNSIMRTPQ